jgi:hypothetical protein
VATLEVSLGACVLDDARHHEQDVLNLVADFSDLFACIEPHRLQLFQELTIEVVGSILEECIHGDSILEQEL